MADWPPVIDADGHVLERQSDIRKYLEPPWNRRNTGLWPSDQPFDTDLFDTLGYPGYGRNMSPAQQVETWLKIMDEHNIEQAVLFPTGSGNIPKLREPEFCLAACRAANDHFAKEYNALSDRIHCVGVLPLKWPQEAAKELRRAVTELTEHRTGRVLVVERERCADRDRQMAPDDAPAAQEVTVDVEQVHRAAVPACHTRFLAEQLAHDGCRRAPDSERRGVVAIAHEQIVVGFEAIDAADVGRLLADRQMAVAADPRARVLLLGTFFEPSDEQHPAQ